MPTTSEASTPSRRAIIKAESKLAPEFPVDNHLQQHLKFTPPLPTRQVCLPLPIFSHLPVEWGLASNHAYANPSLPTPHFPASRLAAGVRTPARAKQPTGRRKTRAGSSRPYQARPQTI